MRKPAPAYRPYHAGYVSEFEQFMDRYRARHPNVAEDQQTGWYLLWDHRLDLDELDKQREASVPVKGYQYE